MKLRTFSFCIGLLTIATAMGACGNPEHSQSEAGEASNVSVKELVRQDVAALPTINLGSVARYDQDHGGIFTSIFGGTTGIDVAHYFNTRIKHYFTPEELAGATSENSDLKETMKKANLEFAAKNLGAGLFIESLIRGSVVKVQLGNRVYAGNSPRVGMMEIGTAYRPEFFIKGERVELPAIYRQGILIHEARHSDCTGGVSEEFVALLRTSKSAKETDAVVKDKSCVHLHSYCTSGYLEGIPACDDHPWGAYAIDLVFLRAIRQGLRGSEQAIVDAQLADIATRFQFNLNEMIDGKMGPPDMTSAGGIQ